MNYLGYSSPKSGNAYAGIIVYVRGSDIKEYIYQQLSQPLEAGKAYCLSFFVSRADRIPYAIKSIGAFFSTSIPVVTNGYQINATPQVVNTGGFISDTVQWVQIQGCFTASGGEQYVTIGNFTSNAMTDTLNVGTNNLITNGETESYYYIDDIQLWDALTTGVEYLSGNTISVYPNPANNILNFEFTNAIQNRKIHLYDALGSLVQSADASSKNLSLATDELPNGIYFYRILVEEKTIKTDKIVIIK